MSISMFAHGNTLRVVIVAMHGVGVATSKAYVLGTDHTSVHSVAIDLTT